jgi:hypothetical protein
MATQAQLSAAFQAARVWINAEAGWYASMIPDVDVQKLCQVVLDAAAAAAQSSPPPSSPKETTS